MSLGGIGVWIDTYQSDEGDGPLELLLRDDSNPDGRLLSFEFDDRDVKVDKATLFLRNSDMLLHDEPAFARGQKLLVTWGRRQFMGKPRRMVVKKTEGTDPLKVVLLDEAVLLDKAPKKRIWYNCTDSDVAREIAEENGYTSFLQDIVDTKAVRRSITQRGSDARMLRMLAHRNGFVFFVGADGLHFHPRNMEQEPTRWYTWRGTAQDNGEILSMPQITANLAADIAKVSVRARDPLTHELVEAEYGVASGVETLGDYLASLGNDEEIGDPDSLEGRRQARVTRTTEINAGYATQAEVEAQAEALYRTTAQGRYKMTVTIRGNPEVGAKQLLGFNLPTETFSGLWYVPHAVTKIAAGNYTIELECMKDALGKLFTKKLRPVSKKKNQKNDDGGDSAPDESSLHKVATIILGQDDQPTEGWAFVDPNGKTQRVQEMTSAERAQHADLLPAD